MKGYPGYTRLLLALPLLVSLLIAGCSVGFMYRQLDWLVPWYAQDYIDLEADQRSLLEQLLRLQIDWHCRTQLPAYAVWLNQLSADPRSALRRPQLDRHFRQLIDYWQALASSISPDLAAIAATVSQRQLALLWQNLEQRNRLFAERYVDPDPEQRVQQRSERMLRHLQRWIGPLTRSQQRAVEHWSRSLQPMAEQWLESRRNWQRMLRSALVDRQDRQQLEQRLRQLLVTPRQFWSAEFTNMAAGNEQLTLQFLSDLGASMLTRQVDHLRAELVDLATEFETLVCA